MQQRRLRLGDILDDYCPRERRITNHAVVAMIDDEVRQTRCTTCDADHEYRHAKMPTPRKKRDTDLAAPEPAVAMPSRPGPVPVEEPPAPDAPAEEAAEPPAPAGEGEPPALADDEGPVHRRLIRATLPRPEGQVPERREPDFTVRQPGSNGSRESRNRPGQRRGRGRRPRGQQASGQPFRFGNEPQGSSGRQGRDDANGNRAPSGQRGDGKPEGGRGRGGPRNGPGQGRKRGR